MLTFLFGIINTLTFQFNPFLSLQLDTEKLTPYFSINKRKHEFLEAAVIIKIIENLILKILIPGVSLTIFPFCDSILGFSVKKCF